MIHAPQLLAALTRQLKRLETDLRQRIAELPHLDADLRGEWQAARDARRCAETFETWADQIITQAGVHWLLSCVFLRFIEDNDLVERPWLSGAPQSGRLALARDRHEAYFRAHPMESDREYLLAAFREAGALPGLHTFFDEAHNPVFRMGLSGDAAIALRQFWQQVDTDTGLLAHDFTDPAWNTRFLGDLYQDLSEAARKRYALLQTPEFVEEFILDRTLTPAIQAFGFREVRMIDPTCGSGHFLLGGFARLVAQWQRHEPGRNPGDVAQRALKAVAGVDLNPFAVAISRFRLLVAALQVAGVHRLANAPDFHLDVAIGDSLLHGTRFGMTDTQSLLGSDQFAGTGLAHAYASEDLADVQRILGRQYHAVVGNPPYIVVKDAALNTAYRGKYASCHMKYSLGCPFTERFFDLAVTGDIGGASSGGFVGLITANSFMKREFGSKLIEDVLPRLDLTHVIDTSGAYIPGHGTPTVILLGRHRPPVASEVRAVMGIRGEPGKPDDAAQGLVWRAIVGQIDQAGSESEFVSVADMPRATLGRHPWSIGGGGAAELREAIESRAIARLGQISESIGFMVITGEDDFYLLPAHVAHRLGIPTRPFVLGDGLRDWAAQESAMVAFPYIVHGEAIDAAPFPRAKGLYSSLAWQFRTSLRARVMFGKTAEQHGYRWDQFMQFIRPRITASNLIAFAEVATHNHFVLDRGGKVFKQTAPVIKLPSNSTEDEHFGLLGLLNSSIACFWFQQVCHNKGGPGGGSSKDEKWHDFYAFNSTKVAEFPLSQLKPSELARHIEQLATRYSASLPPSIKTDLPISRAQLDVKQLNASQAAMKLIAAQEELDWTCYGLYAMVDGDNVRKVVHDLPPDLHPGERAFEIVMARAIEAGTLDTKWFDWLGISPVTQIPQRWPASYRAVVERRIALIESSRDIALIEIPSCKRRWEAPRWADLERNTLREWLLDQLEKPSSSLSGPDTPPQLTTTSRLAETMRADAGFMQVATLYSGHADFDISRLVADLVAAEAVPLLPVLRYTDNGLRKRAQWESTWAMQRAEDAIDADIDAQAAVRREALMAEASDAAGNPAAAVDPS
ncbi:MAG: BREX-2 system adenine-specific DNA-methyltransferase PglX, partial [Burkholderiaceae bacterium]|nr:BREX-2 system adenine-specific DNA-methyltransferase PglX [Burkholderiaceae bacterium]